MSVDKATPATPPPSRSAAESSRDLLRAALKGALATLEVGSGAPYASLVTTATDPDGTPLFLVSRLAVHTRNLLGDQRASLMIDGSGLDGDPLAGGRVTLIGKVHPTASPTARHRFLARHPGAEMYVDFADFGFFAMDVERAHYIGGFGRIVDLAREALILPLDGAEPLLAAEADILAHMNVDHASAVRLYATALLGEPDGDWRMIGIDPEGCDLVLRGSCRRLVFDHRVTTPNDARRAFRDLSDRARLLQGT
jgi:putative heme iron utilization protein